LGCHVIDLVVGVLGKPDRVTAFPRHTSAREDGLVDNMLAVLEYPRATATVRSTAMEVDGFSRRHLTVCGTEGTIHIQPLDNPAVRATFSAPHGDYRAGYQDIPLRKYERYTADAADMAAIIRGDKVADFSCEHDLAVQETVLLASGLPIDGLKTRLGKLGDSP
jgi:predicted dehydrogenase